MPAYTKPFGRIKHPQKPKYTICPETGAIIYEHIYENGCRMRIAFVDTNVNPPGKPTFEGLTYVYSSFAFPTRAQNYIDQKKGAYRHDFIRA